MGSDLDIDPATVESLQDSLDGELIEEGDLPSDMLRRRDACRRLQRTVGRNPNFGTTLIPELLKLLEVGRVTGSTASVDRIFGSEAHLSACRESLLTALSSMDPADVVAKLDDAGYTGSELIELILDTAAGEHVSVQRAGVRALDAVGWLLPDAIAANAEQIASLVTECAVSADTTSVTLLRLLRLVVGLQPDVITEHEQLVTVLAAQQKQDSLRRVLLADCIVMAADGINLSPTIEAFLTDDSVIAILRKTAVERGGLDQLEVAEVLGYEVVCRDSPSGDPKAVERVREARLAERPGAAELVGAIGAVIQTHGEEYGSAQPQRVAESEGSTFLREAQLYGLVVIPGDLPEPLDELAQSYLNGIPVHLQDRASQAIVVGATMAGHMAPKPVIEALLDIYRQSSGFERSVAADALGVLHCVRPHLPDPSAGLSDAFQQATPGGTRQMNLAGACGHTVILDHYTDNYNCYEGLVSRVNRSASYHDELNPGMVGPTAVALGLLVAHGSYDVDATIATLIKKFEQAEGLARQQIALTIGYYVAAAESHKEEGITALAKYVTEHIGTDRGAAAEAFGFTLALSDTEVANPILELLCDCIRGSGPVAFKSVRSEDTIDPAQVRKNVGEAAKLLGEVAVPEYAPSYSPLAQAADLAMVPDSRTQRAATTVWRQLIQAYDNTEEGLIPFNQTLMQLVQRGGTVGKVANAIAGAEDVRPTRDPLVELAKVLDWEDEPIIRRIAAETLAAVVETHPERTTEVVKTVFSSVDTPSNKEGNNPINSLLAHDDEVARYLLALLDQAHQTHPDLFPNLEDDMYTSLSRSNLTVETRLRMVNVLARSNQ